MDTSSNDRRRALRLLAFCLFTTLFTRCACTNGDLPPPPTSEQECGGSCSQGEVCVAERCLPATCANSACNASEACLDGQCVARSCVGVQCGADQVCAAGTCHPRQCASGACGDGEACVEGECQQVRCVGQSCPSGQACANGTCFPEDCPNQSCDSGQVCVEGACVDRGCVGAASCPTGKQPNGSVCTGDATCSSGHCADGVCCDTACDGACQACSATGTCTSLPAGEEDPVCGTYDCGSAGCLTECQTDAQCQQDARCISGKCKGVRPQGKACVTNDKCASGSCADGVCCDSACEGTCEACNLTGHEGTCTLLPAATECRAAAGACDVAELCDGSSKACPADAKKPASTVCRASAGACDTAESCDGTSSACPADAKKPASIVCRPSAAACDAAESCDGTSSACPGDGSLPVGSACTSDGNACTQDVCDASASCTHPQASPGSSCGSGQVCTAAGQCAAGCWIGGTYYASGAANPAASCQECNPSLSTTAWSNKTVNTVCGSSTPGAWSACNYSDTCDQSASRSRTVSGYACTASGTCQATTFTETEACTRGTNGTSCGTPSGGGWSGCSFSDICSEYGTQYQTVTYYTCSSGTCGAWNSTESASCSRSTEGITCGSPSDSGWSTCDGFSDVCDDTGVQSHTITTYACSGGRCAGFIASQAQACTRNVAGAACNDGNPCTVGDVCSGGGACGGTQMYCPGGTECVSGSCQCPVGTTLCSGICVDLYTNSNNCGTCGHVCPSRQVCDNGYCTYCPSMTPADGKLIPQCLDAPPPDGVKE